MSQEFDEFMDQLEKDEKSLVIHRLWHDFRVSQAKLEVEHVLAEGARKRLAIVLESKNHWANRAIVAEDKLRALRENIGCHKVILFDHEPCLESDPDPCPYCRIAEEDRDGQAPPSG